MICVTYSDSSVGVSFGIYYQTYMGKSIRLTTGDLSTVKLEMLAYYLICKFRGYANINSQKTVIAYDKSAEYGPKLQN